MGSQLQEQQRYSLLHHVIPNVPFEHSWLSSFRKVVRETSFVTHCSRGCNYIPEEGVLTGRRSASHRAFKEDRVNEERVSLS